MAYKSLTISELLGNKSPWCCIALKTVETRGWSIRRSTADGRAQCLVLVWLAGVCPRVVCSSSTSRHDGRERLGGTGGLRYRQDSSPSRPNPNLHWDCDTWKLCNLAAQRSCSCRLLLAKCSNCRGAGGKLPKRREMQWVFFWVYFWAFKGRENH